MHMQCEYNVFTVKTELVNKNAATFIIYQPSPSRHSLVLAAIVQNNSRWQANTGPNSANMDLKPQRAYKTHN